MSTRVDTSFIKELKKFGAGDWDQCFNCGNCTAICPLTEQGFIFPRYEIHTMQLGLKDDLASSVEPWLCYYCGECSEHCPRDANPGELMMAFRRWLITKYDWTGLSAKFYKSKIWEFTGIFVLAAVVFVVWALLFGLPGTTDKILLSEIAPASVVHTIDIIVAIVLAGLLISFIFNMYYKIIIKDKSLKIPFILYFTEFGKLVFHFIFQWRFSDCETEPKSFLKRIRKGEYNYWLIHFWLMTGYCLLFIMIVVFLAWFQTDKIHPWWHPQRLFGYYATAGLIVGTIYFAIKRIKKKDEKTKYSHVSDWAFLVLLFLTTITGITMHIFRVNEAPLLWTYYTYLIHLMVAIPMLVIEVPFSKWSHLAYRPFAIYFANLKKAALKKQGKY